MSCHYLVLTICMIAFWGLGIPCTIAGTHVQKLGLLIPGVICMIIAMICTGLIVQDLVQNCIVQE